MKLIDAELSSLSAEADKVILVEDPEPWILHLEFQASRDPDLPLRLQKYNTLLQVRHSIPVASVVFLLRPEADVTTLTGMRVTYTLIVPSWTFQYRVFRVWELDPWELLNSGVSLAAFAGISNIGQDQLPQLVSQLETRINQVAVPGLKGRFWLAVGILLGLKYHDALIEVLLSGVMGMKESSYYQAILREGRKEGLEIGREEGREEGLEIGREEGLEIGREEGQQLAIRRSILMLGEWKIGPAPQMIAEGLNAIEDIIRLQELLRRVTVIKHWSELLSNASRSDS